MVGCLIMHFFFEETYIEEEENPTEKSLCKVYSIYRYFFFPSYRYFRTFVMMVFYSQGFNLFVAGYNYELINKGFSRDTINTIDNLNIIFQLAAIYFLGKYASYWGFSRSLQLVNFFLLLVFLYLWIWFPMAIAPVWITGLLAGVALNWDNLITT